MDAVIVPEPGKEKETLRLLLDLADKPRHVKLNSDDPGSSFYVPEYLAEKYAALAAGVEDDAEPQAAPKRRGRPPGRSNTKAPQAADDKDGEE